MSLQNVLEALAFFLFLVTAMRFFRKSRDFYVVTREYYSRNDDGSRSSEKPVWFYTAIFDDAFASKLHFDNQENWLLFNGAKREEQINKLYCVYAPSRRVVEKRMRKTSVFAYNHILCETPASTIGILRREFKELVEALL